MKTLITCLAALALAAALTPLASAQTGGPVANRQILAVSVLPGSTPSTRDVHVAWTIGLGGLSSASLDTSTEAEVHINNFKQIGIAVHASAVGNGGLCGTGNCGAGCGSGYIDGVFNTLLCLQEGQGAGAGCECRFPSLLSSFPDVPMQPGDELMVLLRPSPGSVPDSDPFDDVSVQTLGTGSSAWDRRIADVTVTPSTNMPDSFFDVWVEIELASTGLSGAFDLTPVVEVHKNGALYGAYETPCGPWFLAPGNLCSFCDGSTCGVITCNGQVVTVMKCTPDDDLGCGCVSANTLLVPIPAVPITPGDVIDVILRPTPGALPELPGFGDDEEPNVGRWLDLGHALGGSLGKPVSVGDGTLIAGDPVTLTLSQARPNTSAFLVMGIAAVYAPFKGGVLVPDPSPPGLFVALPTGAAGVIGLAGVWPLGLPGGFTTFMQWWISDASGPVAFTASNALSATTP